MKAPKVSLTNRELSWLSFSYRILQEAKDHRVPLYERVKFLGIFSSNLDEYFRVRVASLKGLLNLKRKAQKKLDEDPEKLLNRVLMAVEKQQEECGDIFRKQIIPELRKENIALIRENDLSEDQKEVVQRYFREHVEQYIVPIFFSERKEPPFFHNKILYLAVLLKSRILSDPEEKADKKSEEFQHAIIEIPTAHLQRFVVLPVHNGISYIMFLDDVIRFCLQTVFPNHEILGSYSIKLTRDAELGIDDEFSGNLVEKIKDGITKRKHGLPSRFLYDTEMPKQFLALLKEELFLSKEDLVPGARYHNFSDFMDFPRPENPALMYEPLPPLRIPELDAAPTMRAALNEHDYLLQFPYHSFDYVIRLLQEASRDPAVTSIKMTLYRVARDSQIIKALMDCALAGKSVTAFIELKARFDEEPNFQWANELEKVGVKVFYSFPGLKVHAKLCLITRTLDGQAQHYAYLGTGNFNEKTSRVYSDFGLLTSDAQLTSDMNEVFDVLTRRETKTHCEHLLVAPFDLRETFIDLLDNEIKQARKGKPASVIFKMNSLEDPEIIGKLYEASMEGVKISLIVRGICCLVPGVQKLSENIKAVSIIDRFLEHSRVYMFHNAGNELYYLASADLMVRNLSHRIEVAFPVYDEGLKKFLRHILELQLHDNVKARTIEKHHTNRYKKTRSSTPVQSQPATYQYLKELAGKSTLAD